MITIWSAGTGHPGTLPVADIVFPLAHRFRDPHVTPELRELTGDYFDVIESVMNQPGARDFLHSAALAVAELADGGEHDLTVLFTCVGGRHRSVVLADKLRAELRPYVTPATRITVEHRDIDKAVLAR